MGHKDDEGHDSGSKGKDKKLLPIALKGINWIVPIAYLSMIVIGFVNGNYSWGWPEASDFTWLTVCLIILVSVGEVSDIFFNRKHKKEGKNSDQFAPLFNSLFVFSIFLSLFIKGLVWDVFLYFFAPYVGLKLLSSWYIGKTQRVVDLATDKGEKEFSTKEFAEMWRNATADATNDFEDGLQMIRNGIEKLGDEVNNDLKNSLTARVNLSQTNIPAAMAAPMGAPINIALGSTAGNQPIIPPTPAFDWLAYNQFMREIPGVPDRTPITVCTAILKKLTEIKKKDMKTSHYGRNTPRKYMSFVQDAAALFTSAFTYAWEQYSGVLFIDKPGPGDSVIYQRYGGHKDALKEFANTFVIIGDILEGIAKQAGLLGIKSKPVPTLTVPKAWIILGNRSGNSAIMRRILLERKSLPTSPDVAHTISGTFESAAEQVQEIIRSYVDVLMKVQPHPRSMDKNTLDTKPIWPKALREAVTGEARKTTKGQYAASGG